MDHEKALRISTILLTALGLVMVFAASASKSLQLFGNPHHYLVKQLIALCLGLIAWWGVQKMPLSILQRSGAIALLLSLILLALVFLPGLGVSGGGAMRWINLKIFSLQPSEFIKFTFVLFLAKNFSLKHSDVHKLGFTFFASLATFFLLAVLLLKQPDLGTVVLLGIVLIGMLFVSGLKYRYLAVSFLSCVLIFSALVIAAPYRMKRLLSFLDPWSQLQGGGFQIVQSTLAFQNGSFFGLGLGESRQKLSFLPEAHTDFIFSLVGEELGLLGTLTTIGLFALFAYSGFSVALKQSNRFQKFACFGMTLLLTIQALINMGVAMGALPTKGMPLPFVSSGANSLIVSLAIASFIIRFAKTPRAPQGASA